MGRDSEYLKFGTTGKPVVEGTSRVFVKGTANGKEK